VACAGESAGSGHDAALQHLAGHAGDVEDGLKLPLPPAEPLVVHARHAVAVHKHNTTAEAECRALRHQKLLAGDASDDDVSPELSERCRGRRQARPLERTLDAVGRDDRQLAPRLASAGLPR